MQVGDAVLPYVNEVKNLGVVFTSNLSWRKNILSLSTSVHFSLFKLKLNRRALFFELRVLLGSRLILPILDYCCLIYNDLTEKHLTPKTNEPLH